MYRISYRSLNSEHSSACYINDTPTNIESEIHLFADDRASYRQIETLRPKHFSVWVLTFRFVCSM